MQEHEPETAPVGPVSAPGAALVRLVAATVEVVTDFDPIDDEPLVQHAVCEAARAFAGLVGLDDPEAVVDAIDALDALVAALTTASAAPRPATAGRCL
jgi:hypothetical protein